jgi:hypothetical protein
LFVTALAMHVLAGMTCVVAGALAATARKRPGRHPKAGHVYLWGIGVVSLRPRSWPSSVGVNTRHPFAIAVLAFGLAMFGRRARRLQRPGWPRWHATGMGGSCIALLTGFYVDNGPQLPLWNRLPHWTYWSSPQRWVFR